jgi:hypothetical protein
MKEPPELLEAVFASIRSSINEGKIEEAKIKLQAISVNYPPGVQSSKEIGDLFLELGFSAMAGRYWYFVENKSDQMMAICKEYEHSLGDNPILILQALGWPSNPSPYTKAILKELQKNAAEFREKYQYPLKFSRGLGDRFALLGCAIVVFIVMFIFINGVVFIATWFK